MDHSCAAEDEPIVMCPPRGEEEAGYMWYMKRAVCGTRRERNWMDSAQSVYVTKCIKAVRQTRWLLSTEMAPSRKENSKN